MRKLQTIREGRADRRGPGYKNKQEVVLLLDYNYFFLVAKKDQEEENNWSTE